VKCFFLCNFALTTEINNKTIWKITRRNKSKDNCNWNCHRTWHKANFAIISHSSSDFVIDFARILPGVPKNQVRSRVILAPEHAKRLLGALQDNIMRYEREFGPIKIPNQEPRTISPFQVGKGEA